MGNVETDESVVVELSGNPPAAPMSELNEAEAAELAMFIAALNGEAPVVDLSGLEAPVRKAEFARVCDRGIAAKDAGAPYALVEFLLARSTS